MLIRKVRRIFLKDVIVCCCRCSNADSNGNVKGPTWFCTQFEALFDSPKSYNYYISHRAQLFKTHRSGNGDYLTVTLQEDCFEEAFVNQLKVL